jgi:plasmid stabilization system protein ParE
MKAFRFVPLARTDYFDLLDFYEARQTGLGDRFADDVERFVRRVRQFPLVYQSVSRPPTSRDVRIGATLRFKALLVYEVTATHVVVLSVSHRKRRRRPWRGRMP